MLTRINSIVDCGYCYLLLAQCISLSGGYVNYQLLLKKELSERSANNKGYSLRAFARDLEIEPAQLSRVLKGKQNISVQSAQGIARKIFSTKKEQELFVALVALSLAKKPKQAEAAMNEVKKNSQASKVLELSWIDVISDWYHVAIMDLLTLPRGPRSTPDLAKYLGITLHETSFALERLSELGLIRMERGAWRKTEMELRTPGGTPSAAIRRYHKQMLGKALESVDSQGINERLLFGRTMTINKRDLPQLEALTQEYLDLVRELSQDTRNCDSLYQINVQAFNLKSNKWGNK